MARAGSGIVKPASKTSITPIDNKAFFVDRICPLSCSFSVYDKAIPRCVVQSAKGATFYTDAGTKSTEAMCGGLIGY